MTVRTRFAPSPTGYLHIGGARTALFSWLYARRHGGQFVLRIEDTDRERSTPESVQAILDGMAWLGLDHDEGPHFQTGRFDRYREVVQQLLDNDHAYRCYCSKDEIEAMREEQRAKGGKPRYDGRCRQRTTFPDDQPYVIRFKNPLDGDVVIRDAVKGDVTISNAELDDLVIARGDGTPTYNLTVVVDDMDMQITHVIRGDDHLNNTPRQINIYKALGAQLPVFAHVPMILGADGKRLSKRHGAVSVLQYRDDGYLADALLNYLVRLGWSHGDQELFSRDELIALFDIDGVNRAASTFNPEKLLWLNQQYLKERQTPAAVTELAAAFERAKVDVANGPPLDALLAVQGERSKTLNEIVEQSRMFYADFDAYDDKAARKNFKEAALQPLQALAAAYTALDDWSDEPIHDVIKQVSTDLELGMGKVAQPLRVAVSGTSVSPAIDKTLRLLGRERTLQRIARAVEWIQQHRDSDQPA